MNSVCLCNQTIHLTMSTNGIVDFNEQFSDSVNSLTVDLNLFWQDILVIIICAGSFLCVTLMLSFVCHENVNKWQKWAENSTSKDRRVTKYLYKNHSKKIIKFLFDSIGPNYLKDIYERLWIVMTQNRKKDIRRKDSPEYHKNHNTENCLLKRELCLCDR